MSYFDNVCNKCGDNNEGCKCVSVTVPEQTAILDKLQLLQLQLDELKHNVEREVTRRVKNTLESNADLKLEVRNLRAELTDLRVSNKAVTAERDKLHGELVDVRSALAAVSQERDSLRITLDSWEEADTKPVVNEVADHVLPPVLDVGEPDPASDAKDAKLEFRNGIPTKEMIQVCQWWDVVHFEKAICFKHSDQRPIVWRSAGDYSEDPWKYEGCPQPLKPHGMTWQELDKVLADKKAAESPAAPVPSADVPLCMTCHECGSALVNCSQGTNHHDCSSLRCPRTCTGRHGGGWSPYSGPCKSATPVRHE